MNVDDVFKNITLALEELYTKDQVLIDEKTHEQTICAQLKVYLLSRFYGYDVDVEYNRQHDVNGNPDTKKDSLGHSCKPDIIIHKRGDDRNNLVYLTVKGYWNNESRDSDIETSRDVALKHMYSFLFQVELKRDKPELILVSNQASL
jgi:hypothetical protein